MKHLRSLVFGLVLLSGGFLAGCGSGGYEEPESGRDGGSVTVYVGHRTPYGPGWGYRPGYRPRPPMGPMRPPHRPSGPSIQPRPMPRRF